MSDCAPCARCGGTAPVRGDCPVEWDPGGELCCACCHSILGEVCQEPAQEDREDTREIPAWWPPW